MRAGDTLAALAQRYYGDRSRSEVIWETNRLPAEPAARRGHARSRSPRSPACRSSVPTRGRLPAHRAARPSRPAPAEATPPRAEPPPEPEVNPLLADAREALERNDYAVALADVDRFLAGQSGAIARASTSRRSALYRQGKQQLDQRQYGESYKTLSQLVRLQPDYQDSPRLLQQARTRAVERHYNEGLRLYREEKLPEAIARMAHRARGRSAARQRPAEHRAGGAAAEGARAAPEALRAVGPPRDPAHALAAVSDPVHALYPSGDAGVYPSRDIDSGALVARHSPAMSRRFIDFEREGASYNARKSVSNLTFAPGPGHGHGAT